MIPFNDLKIKDRILKKEIDAAIREVVDSGIYILGPKVKEFEKRFASYIGVKYAVGLASGTDAISLALLSIGIGVGDGVIIPANSYPSVWGIIQIGAFPQLVDIDPRTFTIDPEKIPGAINRKTKAILPVHLYGQPADMARIMEIGKKYHLKVIEDCAQAHGAEYRNNPINTLPRRQAGNPTNKPMNVTIKPFDKTQGKQLNNGTMSQRKEKEKDCIWQKVGSIGDCACFSFYPTKNLGAFGDGGMLVTDNEEIANKARLLRMYGEKSRYESVLLGRNSRLDELQAAILLVKLKYLDRWNNKRREIARLYKSYFTGPAASYPCDSPDSSLRASPPETKAVYPEQVIRRVGSPSFRVTRYKNQGLLVNQQPITDNLQLPYESSYARHIYHLFVIRTGKRDRLKAYLEKKGIGTAVHFPIPIHLLPPMRFLGCKKGDFPESEKACEEVLSLPMYPGLKAGEIKRVADTIKSFYQ